MPTDELQMINAFIGFCTAMGGTWPEPLRPHGYSPCGLEFELDTLVGGQPRQVVPELVCASNILSHAFCIEVKSQSVSSPQALAYGALTASNFVSAGLISVNALPGKWSIDVLFVSLAQYCVSLSRRLNAQGVRYPLISASPTLFSSVQGSFTSSTLAQIFSPGLRVLPEHSWPNHFVKFNAKSPDTDLVNPIMQALAIALLKGGTHDLSNLARTATPHWGMCGAREQNTLLNRFWTILDRASIEELKGYFHLHSVKKARQIVAKNSRAMRNGNRRTSLNQSMIQFVNRELNGIPFKPNQPRLPGLMLATGAGNTP